MVMEHNTSLLNRRIGTTTAVFALTAIVMSAALLANCSADLTLSDSTVDAGASDQGKATELYCGFEEDFVPPFYFLYGAEHGQSDATSHSGDYSYAIQADLEVIAVHPKAWLAGGNSSGQPSRVVVWMYDPGPSCLDEATVLVRDAMYNHVSIGFGGFTQSSYYYRVFTEVYDTDIEREVGWHKFEFRIDDTGTTCYIDDIKICETDTVTGLDMVAMGDWWADGVVSSNTAFDDVTVTLGKVGLW